MKKLRTVCLMLALLSTAALAAKKFPMTAASIVPGAKGEVEVDNDKNGNTRVKMHISFLADPQKLTPPATGYVIWLTQSGGTPENEGQLKVDKKMHGSFETVTPAKNFDMLITAEQDTAVKTPSSTEVLKVTVQM